jgi:gliding motility-associated lipoprotein GldH
MKLIKRISLCVLSCLLTVLSCTKIDLYEKTVSIPRHEWKSDFKPSFTFTIKDTSAGYDIYLVLRHNDKYSFNNIYVNLHFQVPGVDTATTIRSDLRLATDEQGWLGEGMDDIYEHRIRLNEENRPIFFKRSGDYSFIVEQIMREDPLKNVLNVGLRVEKRK